MTSDSLPSAILQSGASFATGNATYVLSLVVQAVRRLVRAYRLIAARRELARLDDRALRDIGICRSDIRWLTREKPRDSAGRYLP